MKQMIPQNLARGGKDTCPQHVEPSQPHPPHMQLSDTQALKSYGYYGYQRRLALG